MAAPPHRRGANAVSSHDTIDIDSRREIASFLSYGEAEAAVDALANEMFPVDRVAIVGEGLRYVEDVTGWHRYLKAILGGLVTGAIVGTLLAFFFGLLDWVEPPVTGFALPIYGASLGAVIGALIGGSARWLSESRRSFPSIAGMQAERYILVCDAELAEEGVRSLRAAARRR